jgi:predicted SnoaL-like aldol condensation-catalyzing enzyme
VAKPQEIAMRIPILAALVLVATFTASSAADLEANKQLFRTYLDEVFNKRQPAAADRYLAADFVEHNPNLPQGFAGRKQFVSAVLAGFSDYHGEIDQILAEGNMLVVRILWTGTQDGPFLGLPPSGNKLRFYTADFIRIDNGKLAEHWDVVDSLPRAVALGLVPPPKATKQPATPPPQ